VAEPGPLPGTPVALADAALAPIEQTPLKVQIAERLRRAIVTGRLRPGTVLVETTLAEQLNVSRAPVREAVQILESDGLVETVAYKGKVILEEVDAAARRVRMSGEGRESTGTGSARMSMESRLTQTPSGEVEVLVISDVDVVGRLVQLGRGMIEQVSHQLFAQFAACVKATLEAEAAGTGAAFGPAGELPVAQPVKIVPLVLGAFWAVLSALFRRLLGRK